MTLETLDFQKLREIRHRNPEQVAQLRLNRKRRDLHGNDGKLFIIAADHPARGALGVGANQNAMANRYDLLRRLTIALRNPNVDGVLATSDILDDLLMLGLLEDKIVVGSVNRGGLRDSVFEIDDRVTAATPEQIFASNYDFAKTLVRIDLDDPATVAMLENMASLVNESAAKQLPIMLEPFLSTRIDHKVVNQLDVDSVIKSVAITSALGATSEYSWLKLPVIEEMEEVMNATTLPTLLLGGEQSNNMSSTFKSWERSLELPGVYGLVVGRTLLYPMDDDVDAAVTAAARIVHG